MNTMLRKDNVARENASSCGKPEKDVPPGPHAPVESRPSSDRTLSQKFLMTALDYHRAGRLDQAADLYQRILLAEPDHFLCLHHLGLIAHQKGDLDTAIAWIEKAIRVKPDYAEALANLAALYRAKGLLTQAVETGRTAVLHGQDHVPAHCNLGGALEDQGEWEAALACYRRAVAINPAFIEGAMNAANVLRRLHRHEEALQTCEALIACRPDAAEPHMVLGNILRDLGQFDAALAAYEQALALRPDFAPVYNSLGNLLQRRGQYQEAHDAYATAIQLQPNLAQAHAGLGVTLDSLGHPDQAIEAFRMALVYDPKRIDLRLWLHHRRRAICDWTGIMEEEAELLRLFKTEPHVGAPFPLISMDTSAAEQYRLCRAFGQSYDNKRQAYTHSPRPRGSRKVRIGYLSNDFYRHATALLMVELFERHDRDQFEIIAYSHGPDDSSELALRTREAFDRFVDIRALSDTEAAALIHREEIDILVDLKGYTNDARTAILGLRPAPIQVNFIGFPGTMGVDFIDYIIADAFVLPMDQQPFFSEKIVHMPFSYQPNDTRRMIADLTPTRADCGLPEDGFVFCCFNNSYKLTPVFFDLWMRLLQAVPGSVFWLLESGPLVRENLQHEAEKRGIDPNRLVFAPRIAIPDHLARHRLADLFLDCLPYNAHTTTSDALWAGLPVLTCAGETFAGRVAGSLLQAVGLPELITTSLADYEARALHLARNPEDLRILRQTLLRQRKSAPLFDIALYTRHLESAYRQMWTRFEDGLAPEAFAVAPAAPEKDTASDAYKEAHIAKTATVARITFETCPLCQGSHHEPLLVADVTRDPLYRSILPDKVEWRRCQDCGHVFAEGHFSPIVQSTHFARTLPAEAVGHDMEKRRLQSGAIVERMDHWLPAAKGAWLDVGFGDASLLFAAEEWGFDPVGLEHRKAHADILAGLGYEAHQGEIIDHDWPERFSVISLSRSLERMADPRLGLRTARRFLRRDGALFLSMRNRGTMVWRLLEINQDNPYWGDLRAVHLFDRERISAVLIEENFRPLSFMIDERYPLGMGIIAVRDDFPLHADQTMNTPASRGSAPDFALMDTERDTDERPH
ncbi:tetratricopeptide repeat protein [Beijerinckia indica]|uniref:protein O-GlcNAc transferase n=1 Tax=Beijerinckia indica subsp. indica (strain ATCC 9039 / DSM 1715 / NCIMB 8712) TaxID=395963 RepID=B2IE70_BEII9|nr:tetratricopeptide repeat protein [Beijerinckia indica]ACB94094.1 TPR repeat-containing protein [Beijerinckia indica subsp. indica ATCC 9039]